MTLATPTGVLVADADIPRDEWLAVRKNGIGGSDVAAVLGLSPWESRFALWYRKRGELPDAAETDAMRWGTILEAVVADEFSRRHPEYHVEKCGTLANTDRPWQLANPDRLLHAAPSTPAIVGWEGKTSSRTDGWGPSGTDEIPVYYRAQIQWYMDVTGLPQWWVSVLLNGSDYREYLIDYDPDDAELARKECADFWDSLAVDEAPSIDGSASTTLALKTLHPDLDDEAAEIPADLAADYDDACRRLKLATEAKAGVENRIRAAVGSARTVVCDGRRIATRVMANRVGLDQSRLRREHPELCAQYTATSTTDYIRPAGGNP